MNNAVTEIKSFDKFDETEIIKDKTDRCEYIKTLTSIWQKES